MIPCVLRIFSKQKVFNASPNPGSSTNAHNILVQTLYCHVRDQGPIDSEQQELGQKSFELRTKRAKLNVGGERHETLWSTLAQLPYSRLGRLSLTKNPADILQLCDDFDIDSNEYYFDRSARSFGSVLGLYRTGHLHILDDVCVMALKEDFHYWGISEHMLDSCCANRYYQRKEYVEDDIKKTNDIDCNQLIEEDFGTGRWAAFRKHVWDMVEKPQTSMAARIFAIISVAFIVLSLINLSLSTMPEFHKNVTQTKFDVHDTLPSIQNSTHIHILVQNPVIDHLEMICTIWFTIELLVRFIVAPNKWAFVKSFLNIIDFIAIIPYYFSKIFESLEELSRIVQILRILRILRVFKLARHSQGLQALGYTVTKSYKELGMLMLFVILIVLLFSNLVYFAEKDENAKMFPSIPATFWWAIITMTTVGYGDLVPKTPLGKFIGSICCICGVLVVGLPIPIIVNNFAAYYRDQSRRKKVVEQRKQVEIVQRFVHCATSMTTDDQKEIEDKEYCIDSV